jgi:hypothetical protein
LAASIHKIKKDSFIELHKNAHKVIFHEDPFDYKFDFALLAVDDFGTPLHYYTVLEVTKTNAFISYGGALPDFRGKKQSFKVMNDIIDFMSKSYSIINWQCKNTNKAMIKFGVQKGFKITGLSFVDGHIYLEHKLGGS